MSQSPKKFETPTIGFFAREYKELLIQKPRYDIDVLLRINTETGVQGTRVKIEDADESHPIVQSFRDRFLREVEEDKRLFIRPGRERMRMQALDVISSDVIAKRLNPYLAKYGFEFGQIWNDDKGVAYWGLASLSGINALSVPYQSFGHAFDAALEMIAHGDMEDLPESSIPSARLPELEWDKEKDNGDDYD